MKARAGRGARRPPKADPEWAWFFDIDGTLVEIAQTPSSIIVPDDLKHLLSRLNELSGGALSLITGRAIADVDRFLPLHELNLAGQHGLEIRSVTGRQQSPETGADMMAIGAELSRLTDRHPGLIAEHKGESFALHYRRAPQLAGYAHRFMHDLQRRHGTGLVIQKGKRVVELRPDGADKGDAIKTLMAIRPFKGRVPVFVGDDITDERGFEVVNSSGGYSVKVGPGPTNAAYRLQSVIDVREWIADGLGVSDLSARGNGIT